MASQSSRVQRDQRLNEVLAAFLEAVEANPKLDRKEWLRRYPDLAAELAEFFANHDRMAPLAVPSPAVTTAFPAIRSEDAPGADLNGYPRFGQHEILCEIARGGMGVVYKARQIGLNRIVALKMILTGAMSGDSAMRRFHTEAEAAASLDHPNIVPVYESGEHEGHPYFTMKLIAGGDLAQWLSDCRLPMKKLSRATQRDVARLLAIVARAIHHAHQRGILHRDLKPANILLQRDPEQPAGSSLGQAVPMVTDFGLAKRAGSDGGVSQSLSIVGTVFYMAPEQARSQGKDLTVATDVYSIGAVLYEMLTGQPPFRGDSYFDTLILVVEQPPVPPRQLCPQIDPDLERICLKCLAKAPEERYAGADVLAQELDSWAAGEPVSVRPLRRRERLWRWCRRNPAVAFLLFLVASLILVGSSYSALMNVRLTVAANKLTAARQAAELNAGKAEEKAREAEASSAKAQAALEREQLALQEEKIQREKSRQLLVRQYVGNGAGLADAGDPLGALAWFGEALDLDKDDPARERPHRIRLAAALRRCPRLIHVAFDDRPLQVFCLSGNGRTLFTAERDGPSRLWDTGADKAVVLGPAKGPAVVQAVFSADDRFLATGDEEGNVRLWEVVGGAARGLPMKHPGPVTHLDFSRDSRRLLVAGKDGTARVWDIPAGKPLSTALKHEAEVLFAGFSRDGRLVVTAGKGGKNGAGARVWDWMAAKQVNVKPLHHKLEVVLAAFSPDGQRLFTSANGHNLRAWKLPGCEELTLPLTTNITTGPWYLSPDGQHVLKAQGTAAQVYDLTTGQPVGRPLTHGSDVLLAEFSPDGHQIVTAGWDRVVRVWDTLSGQPLTPPLRHPRRVLGMAFDRTGQRLMTGSEDNAVRLWDIRSREQAAPPLSLQSAGEVLAEAPGGRAVLAVNRDVAQVWDVAAGAPVTPSLPVKKLSQAAFSPDGKRFLTLDAEALRVWNTAGKDRDGRLLAPAAGIRRITFSPDGSRVVARLASNELRLWDTATGAAVAAGKEPAEATWKLPVVSPDGRRVVLHRFRQMIQVWDLATGKLALPVIRHFSPVIQAAYSSDGLRLATACADGTVRVWDAQSAEPLTPPLPHGLNLQQICFSMDGRYLVTAGRDGTARVWEARTGQPVTPLLRHGDGLAGASFSPDGDSLATTSKEGTVRFWDLRPDGRPSADLLLLTRLLSGQQMHVASGSFMPIGMGDLRQSWPQLRARFPAEFGPE